MRRARQTSLTPEQHHVLREEDTERRFTDFLNDEHCANIFVHAECGQPLFNADMKFDGGAGSQLSSMMMGNASEIGSDRELLMQRTEYYCAKCDGTVSYSRTVPSQLAHVIATTVSRTVSYLIEQELQHTPANPRAIGSVTSSQASDANTLPP